MATQQALALQKAMAEIERQLLPFVRDKAFGKISFEFEINEGRVIRILRNTSLSIKIEA